MTDLTPAAIAEGERKAQAREDAWSLYIHDDEFENAYSQACDAFGTWAAENFAALITAARDAARYREALEKIASCRPVIAGDVVSIARAALAGEREG